MSYEIDKVKFSLMALNSILAGGLLGGLIWRWGPQLTAPGFEVIWVGVAFLAIFLPLYPVVSTWKRARSGNDLALGRYLMGAVLGAVVAPVVYYLI